LTAAYYQGSEVYERYLMRLSKSTSSLLPTAAFKATRIIEEANNIDPSWINQGDLKLSSYPVGHITKGIVKEYDGYVRLQSNNCEIQFKLDLSVGMPSSINFDFVEKQEVDVYVAINDEVTKFDLREQSTFSLSTVHFPLKRTNAVSFIIMHGENYEIRKPFTIGRVSFRLSQKYKHLLRQFLLSRRNSGMPIVV